MVLPLKSHHRQGFKPHLAFLGTLKLGCGSFKAYLYTNQECCLYLWTAGRIYLLQLAKTDHWCKWAQGTSGGNLGLYSTLVEKGCFRTSSLLEFYCPSVIEFHTTASMLASWDHLVGKGYSSTRPGSLTPLFHYPDFPPALHGTHFLNT